MDRRTLMAVVLSLGIYWSWLYFRPPAPEVVEPALTEDAGTPAKPAVAKGVVTPVTAQPFTMCGVSGEQTSDGGSLRDLTLPGHKSPYQVVPLYSYLIGLVSGGDTTWKPYGGELTEARLLTPRASALASGVGVWGTPPPSMSKLADGMTGSSDLGVRVTEQYTASETEPCVTSLTVTWKNEGANAYQGDVWLATHESFTGDAGGGMMARYDSIMRPMAYVDGDLEYGDVTTGDGAAGGCGGYSQAATLDQPLLMEGPVSWFGLHDRYFGLLAVPEDPSGQLFFSLRPDDALMSKAVTPEEQAAAVKAGVHWAKRVSLAPGAEQSASFKLYAGPLKQAELTAVSPDLGQAIDLGFFAFFAYPLMWFMNLIYGVVGNWGLTIVLLTVAIKAAFFPMTQSSFRSMQKMQQIRPELDRIQKEFKDDPQKINSETMALFQREKVNPVAGCLPMVLQMPVWFSLYSVLLASTDLYQTPFLYLRDLSAPDPYCIIPIAIMGLFLLQQRFNNMPESMDPAQKMVMKWMPVMFGFFFFAFPSGLGVYVFVNVSLSILQQWWIKRQLAEEKPAAVA